MKIIIPLSQLQQLIIVELYYLTYLNKELNPITEMQLRKEMEKKSSLHNSLKSLIEKGYVMITKHIVDNKTYYAMSPEGEKMFDLMTLISELDLDFTDRERIINAIMAGHPSQYYINDLKENKRYATMCCMCFSIRYVREDKRLAKNNLCIKCQVDQERNSVEST